MIQISPYLTFNGDCREAMTFYQKSLGGELTFRTVAETPIADQCPAAMQDHIMHCSLVMDDAVLMATDMTQSEGVKTGNDIAISLKFDNKNTTESCYSTLSAGGKVIKNLEESFGNSLFGVVQDRYGKVWMLNFE